MRASVYSIAPIGSPAEIRPTKGAKKTDCAGLQSCFSRIPRARPGKSLMCPFCAMRRKCWRVELLLRNLKWPEISSNVGAESVSATNARTKSKTCRCLCVSSLGRGMVELRYCIFVQYTRAIQLPKSSPKAAGAGRQRPRAMEQAAGRPAEGSDAVQIQISVDGRGKTTLRSSQQAIRSELRRRKAGARRVALPSVVLVTAVSR